MTRARYRRCTSATYDPFETDESDSGAVKLVAGVALYSLMLALVIGLVLVVRAERNRASSTRTVSKT